MSDIPMADGPEESKQSDFSSISVIEKLVPLSDKEILDKKEKRNDELMNKAKEGEESFKRWCKS